MAAGVIPHGLLWLHFFPTLGSLIPGRAPLSPSFLFHADMLKVLLLGVPVLSLNFLWNVPGK